MKQLLGLALLLTLITACVVYSKPKADRSDLRKGTKVKVEIPQVPDEEGVIFQRKNDSILVFFDRAPVQEDLAWYSVHDERLRTHDKMLSVLAGLAVVISGTFIAIAAIIGYLWPILLLL